MLWLANRNPQVLGVLYHILAFYATATHAYRDHTFAGIDRRNTLVEPASAGCTRSSW